MAMYEDRIMALTPKGELIQLPKGATPVDFAYAVHTDLGDRTVGAKVNGRVVPLRTMLENGDQVVDPGDVEIGGGLAFLVGPVRRRARAPLVHAFPCRGSGFRSASSNRE